jgi:hypothetical protein
MVWVYMHHQWSEFACITNGLGLQVRLQAYADGSKIKPQLARFAIAKDGTSVELTVVGDPEGCHEDVEQHTDYPNHAVPATHDTNVTPIKNMHI